MTEPYDWSQEPYPQSPGDSIQWLNATRIKRDAFQLQQIIDKQRAEIADLRDYVAELKTEQAAKIDAIEFALRARAARMQNAVDYLTCSERYYPQKIAMALQELRVADAK